MVWRPEDDIVSDAETMSSQWQQNAHAHDTRGMDIGTTRQFEQLVLARRCLRRCEEAGFARVLTPLFNEVDVELDSISQDRQPAWSIALSFAVRWSGWGCSAGAEHVACAFVTSPVVHLVRATATRCAHSSTCHPRRGMPKTS